MGLVKTNMLDTDKILAGRRLLLNRPLQTILLPAAPAAIVTGAAGVAKAVLVDLDPVA